MHVLRIVWKRTRIAVALSNLTTFVLAPNARVAQWIHTVALTLQSAPWAPPRAFPGLDQHPGTAVGPRVAEFGADRMPSWVRDGGRQRVEANITTAEVGAIQHSGRVRRHDVMSKIPFGKDTDAE